MSLYTSQANSVSYNCQYAGLEGGQISYIWTTYVQSHSKAVEPVPRHQMQLAEGAQLWFLEFSVHVNFAVNNSVSATS